MKKSKIIYLDHAAATSLDSRVFNAMRPFLTSVYGNPSSLHHKGVEARRAVESAREKIARILGARSEEIIFTSGGTESCNLAVLGLTRNHAEGRSGEPSTFAKASADRRGSRPHIITTQIEHHAVLEPIKQLEEEGWKVTYLPVDRYGFISVDDLKKAILKDTVLVSVMHANNEIGSIQPIAEIGRLISKLNIERLKERLSPISFHTDACQAAGALDLNVNKLQADLLSLSASKIYGPKGVGVLYVRRDASVAPIIVGGGQERGMRSGTENVAGIVGMAKAMELAVLHRPGYNRKLAELRNYCVYKVRKEFPNVILNGPEIKFQISNSKFQKEDKRLPNNINFTFPGVEGEALMLYLDAAGICVSTGSACATGATDASHVLTAIGRTEAQAKQSIRISLGKGTKKSDLAYFVKSLKKSLSILKS